MQRTAPFTQHQGTPACMAVIVSSSPAPARRNVQQQQRRRQPQAAQQSDPCFSAVPRRLVLGLPAGLLALLQLARRAHAFVEPPPGYGYQNDKLDGYSFFYPQDWQPVTTSGNDVFYRNPYNIEENLFVDISSPSSSKFASVEDLGSPAEAAQRMLSQNLEEFMSTRLGVRRTTEIVSAAARTGPDGQVYYDITTRVKSYASRDQLAVTQQEVDAAVELEWDRRYLTVLGVANRRLYQLRLQAANAAFEKDAARLERIAQSFQCRTV